MLHEIVIAGFGGQGVMAMGKTLAEAGLKQNLNVSWIPSYGPEMRGGSANCNVVISDKLIVSPVVTCPSEVIAMSKPAVIKFGSKLQSGGLLFINSSLYDSKVERDDIKTLYIPCNEIATKLGNHRVANMIMLGAYIGATKSLKKESVQFIMENMFSGSKSNLIKVNIDALSKGIEYVESQYNLNI